MKTLVKINIVLIFLSVIFLSASSGNNNFEKENTNVKILAGKTINNKVAYSLNINFGEELEQLNNDIQTRKYISILNAPETFGGFENYFSIQFTLPDIRAGKRFTRQLKI